MFFGKKFFLVPFLFFLILVFWIFLSIRQEAVVTRVEIGDIRDSVTGNLQVYAESTHEIRSKINGIVKETILKPLGKPVRVDYNETLIFLDVDDLNRTFTQALLNQEIDIQRYSLGSSTRLNYEIEKKDLEAIEVLAKEKKVSFSELERKKNLVERLSIQYKDENLLRENALKNHQTRISILKKQMNDHSIQSPLGGIFMESRVSVGDMVPAGSVLGKIVSNKRLIEVLLNEEEYEGIREGQEAAVTLFSHGKRIFPASVSRLSISVNPHTGQRKLYLDIETEVELPIGGAGRAEIIKAHHQKVLKIPRKALLGNSVFVVHENKVEIREIQTGARNLLFVEVLKGLKEGDMVITDTPHLFSDGQRVDPVSLNSKD